MNMHQRADPCILLQLLRSAFPLGIFVALPAYIEENLVAVSLPRSAPVEVNAVE
jgi:hypothetical protein